MGKLKEWQKWTICAVIAITFPIWVLPALAVMAIVSLADFFYDVLF